MRRVGQTRRRDSNEKLIRAALEAAGAHVLAISGKGAPDLLIVFRGACYGLEVKAEKGTRTAAQEQTRFPIVRTPAEALRAIGATDHADQVLRER